MKGMPLGLHCDFALLSTYALLRVLVLLHRSVVDGGEVAVGLRIIHLHLHAVCREYLWEDERANGGFTRV